MNNAYKTSTAQHLVTNTTTMTYDQAANRAVEMRQRGVPYKKIEAFFKSEGYVSDKTRRPISAVGIRQMVMKVQARIDRPRTPIQLSNGSNPDQSVVVAVTRILSLTDIDVAMKVKLAKALLS